METVLPSQILLSIELPTIAILVGILINNRQIEQLQRHVDAQIGSLRSELKSELRAEGGSLRAELQSLRAEMNARFDAAHQALLRVEGVMDARLKHLEDRER